MSCIQEQPTEGVRPNARENGQIRPFEQAFGLSEVLVAVSTSRLSCKRAGKARTLMPVLDSSGESRLKWSGFLQWNISAEEGRFLQELIRAKRPSKSIEIGCAYGISSLFICEALREVGAKSHTIIDPYQLTTVTEYSSDGYEGIGLLNLRRAGFEDLITFYPEPSYRCLPRLEASQETFDFAFVDGMHTFDYVFTDFFYIDKMLPVGGAIVFDDVFYASVTKLCRYILTNLPYEAIGPDAKQASTLRRKLLVAMAAGGSFDPTYLA